ncbi:glycosyltransferase family 4 protein [Vreelandella populi]|uniref:glycosyltransferase family 4 protein n=1 Tax=Vreelandella populi TaxID=2498858 RepID=UPI000F8C3DE4|nr:glycosyltransferase family 4 protein [Halomonas populi]RUR53218.1 glycosyltransferase [Halomonas populi]
MSEPLTLIIVGELTQRTGGYIYDARMVEALRQQGHTVEVVSLAGCFPAADAEAAEQLAAALGALPEGAQVIIDGLAMGALPEVIAQHAKRLMITALVHHPLGDEQGLSESEQAHFHQSELAALATVSRIIVTSRFTERRLQALADQYAMPLKARVSVVEPGVETASPSAASAPGEPIRLLCVATLVPRKGQDLLVRALAGVPTGTWQCDCYGGPRDAAFADRVQQLININRLEASIRLHGECDEAALTQAYQNAHALVLPSWYEGYGMVVTEALARGLPVITTTGGALDETLPDGAGLKVAPGDVVALEQALSRFCSDADLRAELRAGAMATREMLSDWQEAGTAFAQALTQPLAQPNGATPDYHAGSQFATDWLTLREDADFTFRSKQLANQAAEWLKAHTQTPYMVDLGAGRGSNMRFLAPFLPAPQHWTLVDHDAALLEEAKASVGTLRNKNAMTVETLCTSLDSLDQAPLQAAQLMTASALLDLVSQHWIDMLVAHCVKHEQALLMALSVTGEWGFTDAQGEPVSDDEDHWLLALFIAHQRRDKGLGDALGGQAHQALVDALEQANYHVELASTPWRLAAENPAHQPLMRALIEGWAEAATEQAPEAATRIGEWREQRMRSVACGEVGIWVGHCDLLALPQCNTPLADTPAGRA